MAAGSSSACIGARICASHRGRRLPVASQDGVPSKRCVGRASRSRGEIVDTVRLPFPLAVRRDGFGSFLGRLLMGVIAMNAFAAETVNFDSAGAGALPEGWVAGVTGRGSPRWGVGG